MVSGTQFRGRGVAEDGGEEGRGEVAGLALFLRLVRRLDQSGG